MVAVPTRLPKKGRSEQDRSEQGRSLAERLGLTLVFVLLFSISLSALLAYFNFEKRHRELISSRLQVMLDEVRLGIDYGTGLGLPMSSLTETNEQLITLVSRDEALEKAVVYSTLKQPLFQAGNGVLTSSLPDVWFDLARTEHNAGRLLIHETERYLLVAEPLFNTFDIQSGLVVIAYSRAAYQAENLSLLKQQALQSGMGVVLSAVIGLLLLWLMMRRLRQQISRLSGNLDRQLNHEKVVLDRSGTPDELETRFQLLHDRVQEAQQTSSTDRHP